MTERPVDFSSLPSYTPRRSRLSLRRAALMASVVAGLGVAAYGFGPALSNMDVLTTTAHAQVSTTMRNAQQPVGFADIVEHVKPSVISVSVKINEKVTSNDSDDSPFPPGSPMERFFRRFGGPDGFPGRGPRGRGGVVTGQGSGFFISADGYAVTNNHVVSGADKVEVTTDDGKTYAAKVIGTDPRTDIALIKVDGRTDFPFAKLSEAQPRIGDWVLAVGNPFGLGGTVTAGIVSARGRDIGNGPYDDFIQIDAPVNKGNSGGPAFNVDGEVVGVNTAIYSPSGGSVGIAFSIPAATVKTVVKQLQDKGTVSRGWIGVQIQPVTAEIADSLGLKKAEGALVAEPQANGPAAKAGVESGDVITAVNDKPVHDARELARTIGGLAPGSSVKLSVLHKGQDKTINMTLGELPNTKEARVGGDQDSERGSATRGIEVPKLGLNVAPANAVAGAGKEGVVVTGVEPGGIAAERGFKEGDVILEVAGKAVASPNEVRDALAAARKDNKSSVLIRVRSGDGSRFVALPIGRG
ncbi:Do family serine endopeptidase [Bradyrhizobium sp. U87765 SZCCT0131]|uniref:Do family serine endopeptidase n=1 Tax=unclassified Bradyrhizobium TaxID=2631580 RepID=UPI001BA816D7|nr:MULTISPECIES: Do family serine endopeptidase [unclassified Bradyrhizobium]MBR1222608.1 Do family serine endopeptidase [Bradyrhizobium sp. U87765 SZCCT0131]MBR1265311.1 Do family serine endopeptidase [Bradyrhizobium sp. U87765 SZCCT0134]MBR1302910.1 Do family serine endopeptidase [Bradyrhizobium sp. U87765 SZCCT0110]MBR1323608.1 Do family serine endopeptidase [Bradyrhizobium sp. U87765 SZCCT0109]MBR1346839.1 Do family serine endopeptidase [Bradyrhizobium sp. U87765 SZCCT0048]